MSARNLIEVDPQMRHRQGLSKVGSHKKDVLLHPPGFPPARE